MSQVLSQLVDKPAGPLALSQFVPNVLSQVPSPSPRSMWASQLIQCPKSLSQFVPAIGTLASKRLVPLGPSGQATGPELSHYPVQSDPKSCPTLCHLVQGLIQSPSSLPDVGPLAQSCPMPCTVGPSGHTGNFLSPRSQLLRVKKLANVPADKQWSCSFIFGN